MTATPKRRWFRFSLRTMFVVVTIFGVWLGWNLKIVRERKAVLAEIQSSEIRPEFRALILCDFEIDELEHDLRPDARVSFVRRLMGDNAILSMELGPTVPPIVIERLERAFPESKLTVWSTNRDAYITATRDALDKPEADRTPNTGTIFKTGLIEK